jgi:general secretion pathway protein G
LALENYRLDIGEYPAALSELIQSTSEKWKGPYLQNRIPKDAWGNDYVYQVLEDGTKFELSSTGNGKKEIRHE